VLRTMPTSQNRDMGHPHPLVEERVDEGGAVERDDVFEFFSGSGVDDGEFELSSDGEDDAAFGGAVEFGENDAGDAGGFGE